MQRVRQHLASGVTVMNIPFLNRDNNRPAAIVHDEPVFPHFSGLPMTPDPRQRRISGG